MREPGHPELRPCDSSRKLWFIGDLHGHFDETDANFLGDRDPTLVVFVGDLGDENPRMAQRVAALQVPTRCILGNHDAWLSFRQKAATPALLESLAILGDKHMAYDCHDIESAGVSLVGARPFSWGGPSLRSPELYTELYGVGDHEASAARIVEAAERARFKSIVVVAHNGPYGLGKQSSDIFGKDFGRPGGDWGDLDLQLALRELEKRGFRVPLVVAGHMHHVLSYPRGAYRKRCVVTDRTVYVNVARVPRIHRTSEGATVRHYASASLRDGRLLAFEEHYVSADNSNTVTLFAGKTGHVDARELGGACE